MFKIDKRVVIGLKVLLVGLMFLLIYRQIISRSNIHEIGQNFKSGLSSGNLVYLLVCFFLVPFNWLLESLKWKILVDKFQRIKLSEAFRAILAGLSVGIITPQRVGEYGGRVLFLNDGNRFKGILATFLCSLSQNVVNVVFGLIGVYYLNDRLQLVNQYWFISLVVAIVLLFVLLYLLYRNTRILKHLVNRFIKNERIKGWIYNLSYLKTTGFRIHVKVFTLAILRYIVYLSQYILALWFFGISVSLFDAFNGVSSIYLIQTGIPLPPLMDIAARAELAYLVWGIFSDNVLGILSATFLLWIFNLIIPSLFGLFYVLGLNLNDISD
jgi:hypothetical protein